MVPACIISILYLLKRGLTPEDSLPNTGTEYTKCSKVLRLARLGNWSYNEINEEVHCMCLRFPMNGKCFPFIVLAVKLPHPFLPTIIFDTIDTINYCAQLTRLQKVNFVTACLLLRLT